MSLADESSLLFIPTGYKESKIYSVFPTTGVGDFTFNRNSSATRIAKNGLITSVATDIPRLEYPMIDGVVNGCPSHLLEPQRLQKIQYSEDFSQGYWTKSEVSVNPNNAISPNGTLNADAIIESTTSNAYHRVLPASISGIGGTNYSFSVYVKKKGDTRHIYWMCQNGANAIYAHFDMTNYVVTDTNSSGSGNLVDASITPVGNDWYRISISGIVSSVGGDYYNQIYLNNQLGSGFTPATYTGDGTSGLYLWGWQVESGSYPTSYIPNYGTSAGVTRAAETANGAGDASTFNDSEGVLMAEINYQNIQTSWTGFGLTDGNASADRIIFAVQNNSQNLNVYLQSGGVVRWNPTTVIDVTINNKISIKYKANDNSLWINGFEVATDNSASIMPTGLDSLGFFGYSNIEPTYGKTKQIQYYNSALTDSELEELTSWTSFTDLANGQQYSIK